jgi:hypothetical protein
VGAEACIAVFLGEGGKERAEMRQTTAAAERSFMGFLRVALSLAATPFE